MPLGSYRGSDGNVKKYYTIQNKHTNLKHHGIQAENTATALQPVQNG